MMHRHATITVLLATLLVSCAKQEPPAAVQAPPPAVTQSSATPEDDPNVTRARLNAGGVTASYAAHFDSEKLVRIDEERRAQDAATFSGEYTYQGARLLQYRGAKLAAPAALDLEFDMQGKLRSGQGPDVTDEDVAAIRNRAQLLRSHALAQRSSRGHGSY
jgi:hypothetical protein